MGQVIVDNIDLLEPNLRIPGKLPIGHVKINWEHPLADKLVSFVLCSTGVDIVGSRKGTMGGAVSVGNIGVNRAGVFSTNGDLWSFPSTGKTELLDEITIMAGVSIPATTSSVKLVSKATSDASANPYRLSFDAPSNGLYFIRAGTGYGAFKPSSLLISPGDTGILGVSTNGSTWTNPSFFFNGAFTGGTQLFTGANVSVTGTSAPLKIGQHDSSAGQDYKMTFVAIWGRRFAERDFNEFYRDICQALIPSLGAGLRFIGAKSLAGPSLFMSAYGA